MKTRLWHWQIRTRRIFPLGFVLGWCAAWLLPVALPLLLALRPIPIMAQATVAQNTAAQNTVAQNNVGQTDQSLGRSLNEQASAQLSQGHSQKALATWQAAAKAYRRAGDFQGELRAQLNQAQALRELGFHRRSLQTIDRVITQLEVKPDAFLQAIALQRQGDLFRLVGNLWDAQAKLKASIELLQAFPEAEAQPSTVAATLGAAHFGLGEIARIQGDLDTAIAQYQTVLDLPLPQLLQQPAQIAQLSILMQQGRWADADRLWPRIQQQLAALPPSHAKRYRQIHLAELLLRQQNSQYHPVAEQLLQQAAQEAKATGDQNAQAYALGHLGHRYEQSQQWQKAQSFTQQAIELAQSFNTADRSYQWQWQLGRIHQHQRHQQDAIALYREALSSLQDLRQDLVTVNADVQFSFSQDIEPIYREFVDLLLQSPKQQTSPARLAEAQAVIESLQVAELENFLRKNCDYTATQAIDRVDDKAAVIYPIILRDRLEVILSLPGRPLQRYTASVSQEQLQKNLRQFRHGLSVRSRRHFLKSGQQFYQWLIQPIAQELQQQGIETLVFVPDGELKNVPMAALHDGQEFLIEQYQIAVTPGLNLFAPQPLHSNELSVMAAGISQASQGFSPLNHVTDELASIQAISPSSKVLLDAQFTTPALQAQLRQLSAPIVHFATHGQFSSDAEQTFVLAWDAPIPLKTFDQLLRSVPNGIELLVLSACETAVGDDRAALGLTGVAVDAGAKSTLATLWSVDDSASATFMEVFYQTLSQPGASRAKALRQAQLSLLHSSQFQHPFYWAPYMMIGNWL